MGAQISGVYGQMCGGDSDEEIELNEEQQRRYNQLKPIMDQVKAVDRERKAEDFDMAPYQENKGKSLYIFYIKMFEIMEEEYDTKLAEPTNTLGSDEHHKSMEMKPDVIPPLGIQFMEAEKDETSFDITKSDPFEGVREEWGDWNHDEQR